jgi:DNA (cytosine-5)-methyltransferase 3A
MINASLVSAQSRKRLFWTNIPNIVLPEDRNIFLKDILQTGDIPITKYGLEKLKSNTVRTGGRGSGIDDKHNWDTIRLGQIGKGSQGDRVYDVKGKSVTISAGGGGLGAKTGLYLIEKEIRKLTTVECERLQGLPDRYTEGVSNTQRYKMLGNAFNADVVAHILSFIHNHVVEANKKVL